MRPKLKPGNLVIISVTGTSYSPDGFVTGPARGKNEILVRVSFYNPIETSYASTSLITSRMKPYLASMGR